MNRQPHNYVTDHLEKKMHFLPNTPSEIIMYVRGKGNGPQGSTPALRSAWHHLRQAEGSHGGLQVSKSVLKRHFPQGQGPAGQRLVAGTCYHTHQQDNETTCKFCSLNSSAMLVFKIPRIANECTQEEGLFCLYSFKQQHSDSNFPDLRYYMTYSRAQALSSLSQGLCSEQSQVLPASLKWLL